MGKINPGYSDFIRLCGDDCSHSLAYINLNKKQRGNVFPALKNYSEEPDYYPLFPYMAGCAFSLLCPEQFNNGGVCHGYRAAYFFVCGVLSFTVCQGQESLVFESGPVRPDVSYYAADYTNIHLYQKTWFIGIFYGTYGDLFNVSYSPEHVGLNEFFQEHSR
jgi:hypothetical protein